MALVAPKGGEDKQVDLVCLTVSNSPDAEHLDAYINAIDSASRTVSQINFRSFHLLGIRYYTTETENRETS